MGDARRKKLAGYVPETKKEPEKRPMIIGVGGRRPSATLLMALTMLSDYPTLPSSTEQEEALEWE